MAGGPNGHMEESATVEPSRTPVDRGQWGLEGVPGLAESVYQGLIDCGRRGRPLAEIDPVAADALRQAGLARQSTVDGQPHLVAAPARPVFQALVREREQELADLRGLANDLIDRFDRNLPRDNYMEVIHDVQTARDIFRRAQLDAREQIRGFDRGPFLTHPPVISDEQAEAMARGVEYRVVYEARLDGQALPQIEAAIAMGEQAHVFAELPMKLLISDDDHALIVLTQGQQEGRALTLDAVLVSRSPCWARSSTSSSRSGG